MPEVAFKKSPVPMGWNVPTVFRERMGEGVGRQRMMTADGHLLLILHAPPRPNDPQREGRLFWRSPNGQWESNCLGSGIFALRKHLSEYSEAVQRLDLEEDRAQMADDYFRIMQHITPLHRSARNMHHTLQQARDAAPDDQDLISCRDLAYAVERAADLLHSDIQMGLECAMARRQEEQAQHSYQIALAGHRLNVLAAIFLPVATIASIFGMQLPHGLERLPGPWLFWTITLTGIISGVALKFLLFDKPLPPTGRKSDE
jgi:hypothetical protein